MIVTEETYNAEYCTKIDAKRWRYKTIPVAMKVIYNHFKPISVVDVGCANGIHLWALRKLGAQFTFGIEGTSHWAPYIEKNFGDQYVIKDLREPVCLGKSFDLVMCLEVLEHLEKKSSSQAVKNLVGLGDTLLISACPIIGGFHHLNPQPREYWVAKFERNGMTYQHDESMSLQDKFKDTRCSGWFKESLKVFRK